MLISMDEMHLLVRSEEARSSPWKTLPGLAQLFVSNTGSSCRALNSCALLPGGVFAGVFAVSVRIGQPALVLLWVSPPAPGSGCAARDDPSAHRTGDVSVPRSALRAPAAHPGGSEGQPRPRGRRLSPPERHCWGHTERCFQLGLLSTRWCFQLEIQQRLVPSCNTGAYDAQAYYKLRNFFSSLSSPFFLFASFVFSNGISSPDWELC